MSNRHVGKEGLARHLRIIVFVLAGLAVLARPASAGTITVAWDLMTEANVTGYRIYVGTAPRNYTQTFDVSSTQDFFIFRNAFMGVRYYFAVAAQFDGATFGAKSGEVTAVGTRTVDGSLPDGARIADPAAVSSSCGVDCYVVTDVAHGLDEVSSLAVAGDGTVFAVEDGQRVIVLRGGTPVTAFEAEPGTTLRDLAIDPQFATSGRVFVSLLRAHDRASGAVEVLRLRYLSGALGEPSTIVIGPSVPLSAKAPIAAGDDGLLYLATPVLLARHPYSAAVLAFDQDGRSPSGQRSPLVARGFDGPVDLAWDAQSRAVWLMGADAGAEAQLVAVSAAGAGAALTNVVAAGESAAGVAIVSGAERRLLVAAGLDLIEEAPGTSDRLRISLEAYGTPVAVASSAGARYVATRTDGAAAYRIVKVQDGSAPIVR
jgi:hypothetical protein